MGPADEPRPEAETPGSDPTPNKQSRHLVTLTNPGECVLHIQIAEDDLQQRNFQNIRLEWVDFD